MQEFAKQFYTSYAWAKCREAYRKAAGGLCERCLAKGLYVPGRIVHHKIHITPENIGNADITLNFNNLELVCDDCHADEHSRLQKRYKVDEHGRVTVKT